MKSKNTDHVHTKGSSPLQELGGGKAYRIYCSLFKTDNLTPTPYTVLSKGIFRILTFKNRKKGKILTKFWLNFIKILTKFWPLYVNCIDRAYKCKIYQSILMNQKMLKYSLIWTTIKNLLYQGSLIWRPRDIGAEGPLEGPKGLWGPKGPLPSDGVRRGVEHPKLLVVYH